jgi:sigma-B regulation protein RsbU (phosphoserine phosphatase)
MHMVAASSCHIELFVGDPPLEDVRSLLTEAGYDVGVRAFQEPHMFVPALLHVVDAGKQIEPALRQCHRLRTEQNDAYTPILLVTPDAAPSLRLAGLESGADTSLARPFEPAELLAQVLALLRVKQRHDQLASQAAEAHGISKRLHAANQQMDQELELARRLQESFLPQVLPQLPNVRFAVKYKPATRVGGDFYDIFRLDEKHLGCYIADAMGHGVPASLLTIFIKKGLRAKEISGQTYRLVPPTEVLQKLNQDLIEQQIPDLPFITMVYALFNHDDGTLQFARAGHPYPLYIPTQGKPELWQIEGSLLGVFETQYRLQTQNLKQGDKLLLYTDGMDGASFERHPVGLASLLAAAERFRALPIDELVERLASDLFTQTRQNDDLTVFGMEMVES